MKIVISSGHGKYIRGASGYLDEVDEARKVVDVVASMLRDAGVETITFHDNTSTSQNQNLNTIVNFHNGQGKHDLDISVHFNAYTTTTKPMGTECLYVTQQTLSAKVSAAIADAASLPDRGAKYRSDLFFLNNTIAPAILIEVCFVDSTADADAYHTNFDEICLAITEAVSGISVDVPPDVPEPPVPDLEENRVDIVGAVLGDVTIVVNGQVIRGSMQKCVNAVTLDITLIGDVVLSINGQDFHNAEDGIPENQQDITATVFGGAADYNTSAYDPNKVLNDTDFYVALPDRIEGTRPKVRVVNQVTGAFAEASIEDVGPWNTDDPYWEKDTRPQAESGTDEKGRTTNGAGIDLSPALAKALGIEGKGKVDWDFVA